MALLRWATAVQLVVHEDDAVVSVIGQWTEGYGERLVCQQLRLFRRGKVLVVRDDEGEVAFQLLLPDVRSIFLQVDEPADLG